MAQSAQNSRRDLLAAERSLDNPAGQFDYLPSKLEQHTPISVALVYPNSYHIGMSSLGFQLTYRLIREHPYASCERIFLDSAEGSIESGRTLDQFDLVAISASFEMDDPHVLQMLESAGIPLLASERHESDQCPLILMGGVLVQVNRMPLMPFIDVFVHGDSEATMPAILNELSAGSPAIVRGHRERLEALTGLPAIELTPGARHSAGMPVAAEEELALGIWDRDVPHERYELKPGPVSLPSPDRRTLENLISTPSTTSIISPHTEFSDMVLVDLARGCPHHCTFCWIGHNSPPYRARSIDRIFEAVEPWAKLTDRFGLVSSAVGAHPEIDEVCRWMTRKNLRVSYSSLRVEEVTQTMLETLVAGGQKAITLAPEAGNQRVRRLLGKRISDEQILDVAERAMSLGVENLKLYYMMGIPSETEEESMDIVHFSEQVRQVMLRWGKARGRMGSLSLNLGVFVPKPNLPLNHIEPMPLKRVKARMKKVVKALNKIPNSRVMVSSPDLAFAQSVLSMGGLEASLYLKNVTANGLNWREANRAWRAESDEQFNWRLGQSRIRAERLQKTSTASIT